jgi:DNA-binding transcriptional LysR family regulator
VLTISAPETLCTYRLPPVLHAYRERYPQVTLHLRPAVMMSDLRRAMLEGNVDLAFVLEEPSPAAGLVVEPLLSEVILPLAAPDHRLAGARSVCPIDLQGEALVLTEAGCGYRSLFERSLAAVGVRPGATFDFSSVEAIKQCVIAGMGIAVLPEVAVRAEVAGGRLVPLRWSEPVMQVPIRMVRHKDKWLSPAITAFMEVAREMLAAGADDAPVSTPITSGTAYATR